MQKSSFIKDSNQPLGYAQFTKLDSCSFNTIRVQ